MSQTFFEIATQFDWNEIEEQINVATNADVELALARATSRATLSIFDFMALISPAAIGYLEKMAGLSQQITQRRFGKTMQLYIPLYLSNYCTNDCSYCGFRVSNKIHRLVLTAPEILAEAAAIKNLGVGYEHLLLVTGENPHKAGVGYIANAIKLLKPQFTSISAEIQPLNTEEYTTLKDRGLNAVYVYQETYNRKTYPNYHSEKYGNKHDYRYRLETPERLGEAGINKVGLGVLLGLENWRTEAFFLAQHLRYLEKKYWKTKYSLSFPRMRPQYGGYQPKHPVSEKELAQMIFAFRLFDENVEMSLSTRESKEFRDNIMTLGITSMSAGSRTEPGGYFTHPRELEQFEINDDRTPAELIEAIHSKGYTEIWKDWDYFLK